MRYHYHPYSFPVGCLGLPHGFYRGGTPWKGSPKWLPAGTSPMGAPFFPGTLFDSRNNYVGAKNLISRSAVIILALKPWFRRPKSISWYPKLDFDPEIDILASKVTFRPLTLHVGAQNQISTLQINILVIKTRFRPPTSILHPNPDFNSRHQYLGTKNQISIPDINILAPETKFT